VRTLALVAAAGSSFHLLAKGCALQGVQGDEHPRSRCLVQTELLRDPQKSPGLCKSRSERVEADIHVPATRRTAVNVFHLGSNVSLNIESRQPLTRIG